MNPLVIEFMNLFCGGLLAGIERKSGANSRACGIAAFDGKGSLTA
jgi:hypothetical protein